MSEYLDFAKDVATEAGKIMLEYFETEEQAVETKSDNTPVTIADKKINSMVIKRVSESFPGHGVLGEEESPEGDGEFVWVCDPIDGTRPFTYGIPISTFNLALTRDGHSLAAVQYDPFQDRMYSAALGEGSAINGKPVRIQGEFTGRVAINLEIYSGGASGNLTQHDSEVRAKTALSGDEWYLFKFGSIGYSIGRVMVGALGAAVFSGAVPYEAATANLLITEAGGRFTNLFGEQDDRYDRPIHGFIAAHPKIHTKILSQIEGIFKER